MDGSTTKHDQLERDDDEKDKLELPAHSPPLQNVLDHQHNKGSSVVKITVNDAEDVETSPLCQEEEQNSDSNSNHSLSHLISDFFALFDGLDEIDLKEDDDNSDIDDNTPVATPELSPSKRKLQRQFTFSESTIYRDVHHEADDDLVYFEENVLPDGTLIQAVVQGDVELVQERIRELKWGSKDVTKEVNCMNENELAPLHLAARYNHVKLLEIFLLAGADIDLQGSDKLTSLHIATKYNMTESAKYLIEKGAQTDLKSRYGTTALLFAARRNNAELVELLLQKDPHLVNIPDNSKVTPLHAAMYGKDEEVVRLLLDHGAKIDAKDIEEDQPMHYAADNDNSDIIKYLANEVTSKFETDEEKQDAIEKLINAVSDELNTPLHVASRRGCKEVVEVLISLGADIALRTELNQTALHLACIGGHMKVAAILLDNKARIDARDETQETPLHKAAAMGHLSLCKYLLECGAKLDCNDKDNFTPLMMAVWKGQDEILKFLIEKGANIYVKDLEDKNVLHLAIEEGHDETLKLLFNTVARSLIDQPDKEYRTPLYYAAQIGNKEATEFLLGQLADAEAEDDEDKTPIHVATQNGRLQCVLLLGNHKKESVNYGDNNGKTTLHYAAVHGHKNVCKALIEMGAEISARDNAFWTPLDYAALHGHPKIVSLLLENGAQVDALDNNKSTPLHHASANGHIGCMNILLDNGASIQHRNEPRKENCFDLAVANLQVDACLAFVKHKRWKEVMNCVEQTDGTHPMEKLIDVAPSVAEVVLDKCIYRVSEEREEQHGKTKIDKTIFDFEFLDIKANRQINEFFFAPDNMVQHEQDRLLTHRLTVKLISDRWARLGYGFYILNMLSYLLYLGLLTSLFVVEKHRFSKSYPPNSTNSIFLNIGPWFLLILCLFHIGKEAFQGYQLGLAYFEDAVNYLEIALYISTMIFLLPMLVANFSEHNEDESTRTLKWFVSSLTILLGWSNMLLYLKRFPFFGLYVVMFVEVFKSLISVLPLFSIFIVGFALSFYVLLDGDAGLKTVGRSIMKTGVMTIGEFEFNDIFINNNNNENNGTIIDNTAVSQHHTTPTAFIVFIIFMVLMSILTMNFLVGLAVGDIDSVRKNAYLRILKAQVHILKTIQMKYPKWYLMKKYRPVIEEVSSSKTTSIERLRMWFKKANYDFVLEEQDADYGNEKKVISELENNGQELKLQMGRLKKLNNVLSQQQQRFDDVCEKLGIDLS